MDALDRFSVAVTGSDVRFSTAARDSGIEPLIDLELRAGLGALDPSTPQLMLDRWAFLRQVSGDLHEVELSLECLNNVPVYLRRFPYRKFGVSRAAHLQYHTENWLNEVYILEKRFERFAVRLARAYRKHAIAVDLKTMTDEAIALLASGLRDLRVARGGHVHKARYVDRDILLLSSSELIVACDPAAAIDPESEFRQIRRVKATEIAALNAVVRDLLVQAMSPLADTLVVWEPPCAWLLEPFPA